METDRRLLFIKSLRDCADFLERHPQVPAPYSTSLNAFLTTREEMAVVARASTWQKVFCGNYFVLSKAFGVEGVSLEINCNRETICHKVVTGTRVVPAREESVEDIVEWQCDDLSLLAPAEAEIS